MIIGIDIGSTITKAVSVEGEKVVQKVKTRAIDAVTSATGALGKLILENNIRMNEVERIMITGVGSVKIESDIFGIPTQKIEEFRAVGIGGMFQVGRDNIIITNIGTGTAIVQANRQTIAHIGGSGVGGGTILGLSKRLVGLSAFNDIMEIAAAGSLNQVDLLLEDIMDEGMGFLGTEATAANFGKMLDTAKNEDLALAIINMVYQVIGVLSVFAAREKGLDRVVVAGSGSDNPIGQGILNTVGVMYGVAFEFPPDAQYTTAIGAALSQ
jgi:type II pantothenate kinase